jgi:hypothetical protein
MARSTPDRDPISMYEDPVEMKRLGEAMLPFLRDIGRDAKGYKVTYDKRKLVQLLGALKGGYFMRAVEKDPELTYDIKMMAANATTSMAKFGSFVLKGVESPAFDDFVKLLWFARDRMDRVVGYLNIHAQKVSELEKDVVRRLA